MTTNTTNSSSNSTSTSGPSYSNVAPVQPAPLVRRSSFTHSFPSRSVCGSDPHPKRKGLSAATIALAREVFRTEQIDLEVEKTRLFCGGLQWLVESTIQDPVAARPKTKSPRRMSLTEDAVRTFNLVHGGKRRIEEVRESVVDDEEDQRTADWVCEQSSNGSSTPP